MSERAPESAKGLFQSIIMDTVHGLHRVTLDRIKKLEKYAVLNEYINARNNELFGNGTQQHREQIVEKSEIDTRKHMLKKWIGYRAINVEEVEQQVSELVEDMQSISLESLAEQPNDYSGGMSVGLYSLELLVEERQVPRGITIDFDVSPERIQMMRAAHATLKNEANMLNEDEYTYTADRLREASEELLPEAKVLFESGPGLKYWTCGLAESILLTVERKV